MRQEFILGRIKAVTKNHPLSKNIIQFMSGQIREKCKGFDKGGFFLTLFFIKTELNIIFKR